MANTNIWYCPNCNGILRDSLYAQFGLWCSECERVISWPDLRLTPSADLPACRDEDPATPAVLAAAYPDPPEYQHPEEPEDADR